MFKKMTKKVKIISICVGIIIVISVVIFSLYFSQKYYLKSIKDAVPEISYPSEFTFEPRSLIISKKMVSGENKDIILSRKIIKKGNLQIEVEDYQKSLQKIRQITQEVKGFIFKSSMHLREDGGREGTVIIKVPPEDFNNAMSKLEKLGRIKNHSISGEDVTDEYIDLTARLKNAERVEEEFAKILEKRAQKIDEILKVEAELSRIREKIEQLKGKIKYIDNMVNLATIDIKIYEPIKTLPRTISIFHQIREAFKKGFEYAMTTLTGIIIFTCTITPIIGYVCIIGLIIYIIRIINKKIRQT